MAKKAPVGTVRYWASGPVIKAHDNSSLKEAWVPLPSTSQALAAGRKLDMLASEIVRHKIPLQGEKYLDREIVEFQKDSSGEGPYHPNDFKQYIGHYGITSYSFSSEFSRREMSKRLALEEEILRSLQSANEKFQSEQGNWNQNISAAKIKEIKARVRANFVYEGPVFKIEEALALGERVKKVHRDILKGLDFEGDEERAYTIAKNLVDRLPLDYDRLFKKKESYNKAVKLIETVFANNWAVRESFKDYAKEKYQKYLKKYRDEIKEDSIEDQKRLFGVTHETPREEFYSKLVERVEADHTLDFFDLLELRFATQIDIELEGEWEKNTLEALRMFEQVADELPEGHVLSNESLKSLRSSEFSGSTAHGSYAFYEPSRSRITLSDALIEKSSVIGRITEPDEFRSTLVHEIGHSVSKKLGRDDSLSYKKFVVECGWSYQQEDLQAGTHATGNDRRIPREGRNLNIPLISDYAHVSQEEAFAEYFSFYHNNKEHIDKFLETGDSGYLKKDKVFGAGVRAQPVSVMSLQSQGSQSHVLDIEQIVRREISTRGSRVTITPESPFQVKISLSEQKNLDKSIIRSRKDLDMNRMPPVVAMQTPDGKTVVIDGVNRVVQAKLNHHLLPTINLSQELVQHLYSKGYKTEDIVGYATASVIREDMPALRGNTKPKTIQGLKYGREFIPFTTIHKNISILEAMKSIYSSDELAKALFELNTLL